MDIIAIDPGSTQSAYVEYCEGKVCEKGKFPNGDMVAIVRIKRGLSHLAIEMPACYGMAVGKSVFETCRWVGVFQQAFGLDRTHLVYRKSVNKEEGIDSVCMHLCKNNRAKDSNVRQAIIDRFPATGGGAIPQIGTKANRGPLYGVSKDVWAALAVAITFTETFEAQLKRVAVYYKSLIKDRLKKS